MANDYTFDKNTLKITPVNSTPANSTQTSSASGENSLLDLLNNTEREKTSSKKNTGGILGQGLKNIGGSLVTGATKRVDSILDAPYDILRGLTERATEGDNSLDANVARYSAAKRQQQVAQTHALGDKVQGFEQKVDTNVAKLAQENPDSKLASAMTKGAGYAQSMGGMAVDIGLGALTAGSLGVSGEVAKSVANTVGLASMWAGVYDSTIDQKMDEGYDFDYASKVGFVDATVEVITESMWGGIAGTGGDDMGFIPKIIGDVADTAPIRALRSRLGDSIAGPVLAKVTSGLAKIMDTHVGKGLFSELTVGTMFEEALEEMTSEVLDPIVERIVTGDESIENASIGQILEAGLGGALMSAFMSPVTKLNAVAQERQERQNQAELDNYRQSDEYIMTTVNQILQDTGVKTQEQSRVYSDFVAFERDNYVNKVLALSDDLKAQLEFKQYSPEMSHEEVVDYLSKVSDLYKIQSMRNMDNYHEFAFDAAQIVVSMDEKVKAATAAVTDLQTKFNNALVQLSGNVSRATSAQKTQAAKSVGFNNLSAYNEALNALIAERTNAVEAASNPDVITSKLRRAYDEGTLESQYGEEVAREFHNYIAETEYVPVRDAEGNVKSYSRDQLAQKEYGMTYQELRDIGTTDLVDELESRFQESLTSMRRGISEEQQAEIINTLKTRLENSGVPNLNIEFSSELKAGTPAQYDLTTKTIRFNPRYVRNAAAAEYFLGHELIHRAYAQMSGETLESFKTGMKQAMELTGYNYDEWLDAIAAQYSSRYFEEEFTRLEAQNTNLSDSELADAAFEAARQRFIAEEGEEEVYARFASWMFSSRGIINALNNANESFVAQMQGLVDQSVLKNSDFGRFSEVQGSIARLISDVLNNRVEQDQLVAMGMETRSDEILDEQNNNTRSDQILDTPSDIASLLALRDSNGVNPIDRRYSALIKAVESTTDKAFNSARGNLIKFLQSKGGVKADEIKYSGLEEYLKENPKATRQEVLDYLNENSYVLTRTVREGDSTAYEMYSSRGIGGTNYREFSYSYPDNGFNPPHQFPTGTIVHARTVDFVTPEGKKVLFIDEIQSDLHNAATAKPDLPKFPVTLSDGSTVPLPRVGYEGSGNVYNKVREPLLDLLDDERALGILDQATIKNALSDLSIWKLSTDENLGYTQPPDAPYKKDGYVEYALKDMLDVAAQEGYDYVAWTTPKMQEERWSDDYAEGYKIEYGQQIPAILNRIGKKYGASVSDIGISTRSLSKGMRLIDVVNDIDTLEPINFRIEDTRFSDHGKYFHSIPELLQAIEIGLVYDLEYDAGIDDEFNSGLDFLDEDMLNIDQATIADDGRAVWKIEMIDWETGSIEEEIEVSANVGLPALEKASANTITVPAIEVSPEMRRDILANGQTRFDLIDNLGSDLSPRLQKLYQDAAAKYGVYEGSDIIRKVDDDTPVSRFTANVATQSDLPEVLAPEIKKMCVDACINTQYAVVSDKDSLEAANKWFSDKFEKTDAEGNLVTDLFGAAHEYISLSEAGKVDDKNMAVRGQLVIRAIQEEIAREGDSVDPSLINLWSKMIAASAHDATRAAQTVQSFSMLKKIDATGRMYYIERAISDIEESLKNQKADIFGDAKKVAKSLDGLRESEDYRSAIAQLAQAKTSEELDAAEQHLIEVIAARIPATMTSRLVAWRYLSMLGNIRTHERNILSNAASYIATGLTNKLSGAWQDLGLFLPKDFERTATLRAASQATKDFVAQRWEVSGKHMYKTGGKMASFQTRVDQARKNFGNNVIGNFLEKAYEINNEGRGTDDLLGGLEGEDTYFGKLAYKRAMENYITANNIDVALFTDPSTRNAKQTLDLLGKIDDYAMRMANQATYHEASLLASKLNELESSSPLGKLLVGGIAPFKRTPMNILKQGYMYAGGGIIKGINQLRTDVASGKVAAGEAINNICMGLTGWGIIALGMFLKGAGVLKGGGSDDDREEYYDEMLGNQKYSLNIGDTNVTIDWLTPVSMPLFVGAELMNSIIETENDEDDDISFEDILGAIGTAFDPLTNLSLLSGVNDALSAYGNDNKIAQLGLSAAESYVTQFIPTLAGQVARAVDPVRRTTYAPKDSDNPLGSRGEKFLRRIAAKIPFLSQTDEPYVDMWGEEDIRDGGFLQRFAEQALVPWYSARRDATSVDDRLADVFAEAGTSTVLPATPNSYLTVNGETVYLSAKDYTEFKRITGRLSYNGVDTATSYNVFNQLDADTKADIISDIYSMARTYAKYQWAMGKGVTDYAKQVSKTDNTKITKLNNAIDAGMTFGQYMTVKKIVGQVSKKAEKIEAMQNIGLPEQWMDLFLN